MTTKLNDLKTELREFIELSKTITQGKWIEIDHDVSIEDGWIACPQHHAKLGHKNAVFIARSRNISPAMAECLLAAIDGIERLQTWRWNDSYEGDHGITAEIEAIEGQILDIWEAAK